VKIRGAVCRAGGPAPRGRARRPAEPVIHTPSPLHPALPLCLSGAAGGTARARVCAAERFRQRGRLHHWSLPGAAARSPVRRCAPVHARPRQPGSRLEASACPAHVSRTRASAPLVCSARPRLAAGRRRQGVARAHRVAPVVEVYSFFAATNLATWLTLPAPHFTDFTPPASPFESCVTQCLRSVRVFTSPACTATVRPPDSCSMAGVGAGAPARARR